MVIYSKSTQIDFRKLDTENKVAFMYEIIGLHQSYSLNCESYNSFYDYCMSYLGTTKFHFKNRGEVRVKQELYNKGYNVSRSAIRLLARTYKNFPVISTKDMGCIFKTVYEIIHSNVELENTLFLNKIQEKWDSYSDILDFQYNFVSKFVWFEHRFGKKHDIFAGVLSIWENTIKALRSNYEQHKII